MRQPWKLILWVLPVFGLVVGYAYAYVLYHGLLETWHFVGKPGEAIARIDGIRDARKILVATQTGKNYSLQFGKITFNGYSYEGEVALPLKAAWEREAQDTVDPAHPLQYIGADFYSWPPLFQVDQLFKADYLYDYEGKGEVKFALAADGNLWMWNHQIGGMTGVVFQFAPVMGFLAGLLIVVVVIWVNRRKGRV